MAREKISIPVPLTIRLIGTNEKEGRQLLEAAGIDAYTDLTEAVQAVVGRCRGKRRRHEHPHRRRHTRVIVQGITGRDGSFHARSMREYGTAVVGGVTPGKGGQAVEGIPVFDTVADAVGKTGADCTVIFVPARFAGSALQEALGCADPPGRVHHGRDSRPGHDRPSPASSRETGRA